MAVATLTQAHRRELVTLTGLAANDLSVMWRRLNGAESTRDALMDVLPRLIAVYGSAAATLGADYYDEARALTEARRRFRAIPAELPDEGRSEALARWGVGPLFQAKPDPVSALTLVTGGLQRIIANADRDTVRISSVHDPAARGWQRVGDGGCEWCRQYLDGEVHYTEGYDFDAHDHCHCTAEPAF